MTLSPRTYARAVLAGTLLALGGCASGNGDGTATAAVPPAESDAASARHPERKLLVTYGQLPYRVNVRYVGMIGQSVIAVRRGAGEAAAENWERLAVEAEHDQPAGVPFADRDYEDVALDIADAVSRGGGVCKDASPMAITMGSSGDPRTMYRDERQAWVVFARCPKPAEG